MTKYIGLGLILGFFQIGCGLTIMGFSPAWMLIGLGGGIFITSTLSYLDGPKKDSEDD